MNMNAKVAKSRRQILTDKPSNGKFSSPKTVSVLAKLGLRTTNAGVFSGEWSGGGKLLVESACARLAGAGYEEATLWTLAAPSNRAHGFYAHLGWTNEGICNSEQPPDVRYRRRLS